MTDPEVLDDTKKRCWIESRQHFGAAYIFERRARPVVSLLQAINYVALAVPLFIGALVMALGTTQPSMETIVKVGGVVLAFQLLLSLLVVINRLDDKLVKYVEAKSEHYKLFFDYKELGSTQDVPLPDLKIAKIRLDERSRGRYQSDSGFHICDWEKRMGMRSALREAQAICAGCKKIPISMKTDDCSVCGLFRFRDRISERIGL